MPSPTAPDAPETDPNRWLEDVLSSEALAWVEHHNRATLGELTNDARYPPLVERLQSIYSSDEQIPYVALRDGALYNLWQDEEHPQGLWRRTTLESYRSADPVWETVLDLDALSAAEGKRWVWHGASCLPPTYRHALLSLSPGGSDADILREFDTVERRFVSGGFELEEAKSSSAWVDADTLLVSTDFGPGSMTTSGYPRTVRRWARGTALADAPTVFEGEATDVSVSGWVDHTPGFEREFMRRIVTFYTSETHVGPVGGPHTRLDIPDDATAMFHRQWLMIELRSDWVVGARHHASGSLLVIDSDRFLAGDRDLVALFTPTERTAIASVVATRHAIVVNALDNVRSTVHVCTHSDAGWSTRPLPGLPAFGSIGVSAVDPDTCDDVWLTVTDFLTPTTLSMVDVTSEEPPPVLKSLPSMFDTSTLEVSQHHATSADGTAVPYFQIGRIGQHAAGGVPTLLYGYGGFEASLTPNYSPTLGAAWLERGGVYVIANIRGGGEFGPRWHQAALKAHRHRAYEDFAAVADDLVQRGITTPAQLGAMGGSNGGLLVGNMLTQYPERFGAIVCQVPLLDMQRYHLLLAGASWMGEYGDPEDPDEWSFIQTFSPYHLASPDRAYPRTLFTTSTRDDRVHPGHARKMVARLVEQGHDVLYWENTEGGHGGAANNAQRAQMWGLSWVFLARELGLR